MRVYEIQWLLNTTTAYSGSIGWVFLIFFSFESVSCITSACLRAYEIVHLELKMIERCPGWRGRGVRFEK